MRGRIALPKTLRAKLDGRGCSVLRKLWELRTRPRVALESHGAFNDLSTGDIVPRTA
jgi:hypothetical protein